MTILLATGNVITSISHFNCFGALNSDFLILLEGGFNFLIIEEYLFAYFFKV